MAEEVNTPRGILMGGAQAGVSASAALAEFHKLYPGKSADIEQAIVHDWSKDPWADMCERTAYKPGQLGRFLGGSVSSLRARSFRRRICGAAVAAAGGCFGIR